MVIFKRKLYGYCQKSSKRKGHYKMNVDLTNQIYKDVKEYLQANSKYAPRVTQKSLRQSDKFPLVTVTEDNNTHFLVSTDYKSTTDQLFITINIYAQDAAIGNETISNVNIARELMRLVDNVMANKYHMLRSDCRPTPNLDETIYRITMKYNKKIITDKNILI